MRGLSLPVAKQYAASWGWRTSPMMLREAYHSGELNAFFEKEWGQSVLYVTEESLRAYVERCLREAESHSAEMPDGYMYIETALEIMDEWGVTRTDNCLRVAIREGRLKAICDPRIKRVRYLITRQDLKDYFKVSMKLKFDIE